MPTLPTHRLASGILHGHSEFQGFEPLDANYIYCPNQFFDLCLRHCSRGAVRFVAYLIVRTLAWRDENGNPINEVFGISDRELVQHAAISKGAIRSVADEVVSLRFVQCVQEGKPKSKGCAGQSAKYMLRWDEKGDYVTDLNGFQGFYASGGNCSPIPRAFFDTVIPFKRLAMTKVIGTVLRHTAGFECKYGGRRQQAVLPLSSIQRYANIKDRKVVVSALDDSVVQNFIRCLDPGRFTHRSDLQKAAVYAPKWLGEHKDELIGPKSPPADDRSKKPTRNGPKKPPANQSKKPTSRKRQKKDISKQDAVVSDQKIAIGLLTGTGFDMPTAKSLVGSRGLEVIQRQIEWLPDRKPRENPLGMLRRAIEEDWPMPTAATERERRRALRKREEDEDARRMSEEAAIVATKKERACRRKRLLGEWEHASPDLRRDWIRKAASAESSAALSGIIRRQRVDSKTPHVYVLDFIAAERGLPPVTQSEKTDGNRDAAATGSRCVSHTTKR